MGLPSGRETPEERSTANLAELSKPHDNRDLPHRRETQLFLMLSPFGLAARSAEKGDRAWFLAPQRIRVAVFREKSRAAFGLLARSAQKRDRAPGLVAGTDPADAGENRKNGAGGRNRTGTEVALQRILSPVRLPVPPRPLMCA